MCRSCTARLLDVGAANNDCRVAFAMHTEKAHAYSAFIFIGISRPTLILSFDSLLLSWAVLFVSVSSTCMSDCYGNVATASQISAQASSDKLIRYQHRQAQTSSSVTTAHQIRPLAQCRLSSVPCRSLCFELTVQSSCFTFLVLTVLQPDVVQAPQDGASEKPSKEFEHGQEQEQAKSSSLGNKRASAYCVGFY